jgi:ribosome-associated translation inhibitor RaiA
MAQSEKDDLYKAIVEAKDELKLEIEKYKFKKIDKTRRQQRKAKQETRIE